VNPSLHPWTIQLWKHAIASPSDHMHCVFLLAPHARRGDSEKSLITDKTSSKPERVGCSALCKEDGSFAPAHMLADPRLERAGRSLAPDLERRSSELSSNGKLGVTRTAALVSGLLTAAFAVLESI